MNRGGDRVDGERLRQVGEDEIVQPRQRVPGQKTPLPGCQSACVLPPAAIEEAHAQADGQQQGLVEQAAAHAAAPDMGVQRQHQLHQAIVGAAGEVRAQLGRAAFVRLFMRQDNGIGPHGKIDGIQRG